MVSQLHRGDGWPMCAAALAAAYLGVDAERKSLELVAPPLGSSP